VLRPLGYVVQEGEHIFIVSECMERRTLHLYMTAFTMRELFTMSLGIAEGICYLHANNVVHRDINTYNVLISPSGEPLLANFDFSLTKEPCWTTDI